MVYSNPFISYFTSISLKWWAVIFVTGILFGIIACKLYLEKKVKFIQAISLAFMCEYLFFVLVATVLSRETGPEYLYKLQLFWSYRNFIEIGVLGVLLENAYNILLLLPIGALWRVFHKKMATAYMLMLGCAISIIIEVSQLILKRGYFEFEDIFHNSLGFALGYILYKIQCRFLDKILKLKFNRNNNKKEEK